MPPQRVNIQYSIDIEQLPQEVRRLAENIDAKLATVGKSKLTKSNKDTITLERVNQIVELRLLLAEIDHNLMDVENIMNGYIRFQSTPAAEQAKPEEEEDQRPTQEIYPDEELLDNLESKIRNFKNTLSDKNTNDQNPTKEHKTTEQVSRSNT